MVSKIGAFGVGAKGSSWGIRMFMSSTIIGAHNGSSAILNVSNCVWIHYQKDIEVKDFSKDGHKKGENTVSLGTFGESLST